MPDRKRLVFTFAVDVLDSFEKLEVVVALDRAGRPLSEADLGAATGVDARLLAEAVDGLCASAALAEASGTYRLDRTGPWAEHLDALLALYKSDRMEVVSLMSTAALQRLRSRASRAFADAFVIRKKKGQDDG